MSNGQEVKPMVPGAGLTTNRYMFHPECETCNLEKKTCGREDCSNIKVSERLNKNQYIVGNVVFGNNQPETIIPLNQLPNNFKKIMNKSLSSIEMINKIKEFKEYFCKYRCEYMKNRISISDCDYVVPCSECQIDRFIEVFELENM